MCSEKTECDGQMERWRVSERKQGTERWTVQLLTLFLLARCCFYLSGVREQVKSVLFSQFEQTRKIYDNYAHAHSVASYNCRFK